MRNLRKLIKGKVLLLAHSLGDSSAKSDGPIDLAFEGCVWKKAYLASQEAED